MSEADSDKTPKAPAAKDEAKTPAAATALSNKELKELKKKEKAAKRAAQKEAIGITPEQQQKIAEKKIEKKKQQTATNTNLKKKLDQTLIKNDNKKKIPALFSHLETREQRNASSPSISHIVHPAILSLALKISGYKIVGSIPRLKSMLLVFKTVIQDYQTPANTSLQRHLTGHLSHQIEYLKSSRPLSISMGNAIRWLKQEISHIPLEMPDQKAKDLLCDKIDEFVREKIELSARVIIENASKHITEGSTVLTYGRSQVLEDLFKYCVLEQNKSFNLVIVDSRPLFEGKKLLDNLTSTEYVPIGAHDDLVSEVSSLSSRASRPQPITQEKLKVHYVLLNSLSSTILEDVDCVLLGAHAMLSNGRLYSRVGTGMIAMMCHTRNIPVLTCCESVKFSDKVQLDSVTNNELADSEDLLQDVHSKEPPKKKSFALEQFIKQFEDQASVKPTPKQKGKQQNKKEEPESNHDEDPLKNWKDIPNLNILNIMYDLTPPEYIKKVITELGALPPSSVPVILREYRTMASAELDLVNKVDLRIALANTDEKFEQSLKLYLAPVLLKLGSPNEQVKNAVFKMISNIIGRLNAARTIKLPAHALLDQVKAPKIPEDQDPTAVRLYSLVFVSKAIDRMDKQEKTELVPKVVVGINKYSGAISARLFYIFCRLIEGWKSLDRESAEYKSLAEALDFATNQSDEKFLCERAAKFFMLQPTSMDAVSEMPGLSVSDVTFFTKSAGASYQNAPAITSVKKDLLEFLKFGFKNQNLYVPLLVASCDSSSVINDPAEIMYRKTHADIEDKAYLDSLVTLFLGDSPQHVPPVKPTIQEKIMAQFCKSTAATKHPRVSELANLGLLSDYAKLKQATVQFIKWISINNVEASKEISVNMHRFNSDMAQRLRENLLNEGWPRANQEPGKSYSATINQRSLQYETICNILKVNPELFVENFDYLQFLFDSLQGEETDLRSTIQEGLSNLTVHLPKLSADGKSKLKDLADTYLSLDNFEDAGNLNSCRYVVLKFINCAFPFEDPLARYYNILGTATTNRPETIEEAVKGLHPHWFNIQQSSNTTEFKSTSELLGEKTTVTFPSLKDIVLTLENKLTSSRPQDGAVIFRSMTQAIEFCVQTLVMQAVKGQKTVVVPDEEWSVRLNKALEVDTQVRQLVVGELSRMAEESDENPFVDFMNIIHKAIDGEYPQVSTSESFQSTFVKLLALSPSAVVGSLSGLEKSLLRILNERTMVDAGIMEVARAVGIIVSHPVNGDSEVKELLNTLVAVDTPPHKSKPNLLTISYLISRLTLRDRILFDDELLQKYCARLLVALDDTNTYNIALQCVQELASYGDLGPVLNREAGSEFINQVVEKIQPKVKKCDERSVLALASLSLGIQEGKRDEDAGKFEQLVYDTHISKQVEYLFTSGEAFSIIAAGWESRVLTRTLDVQDSSNKYVPVNIERLPKILETVLNSCNNTKPSLRRAGCIWLLSLVDFCSHLQIIRDNAARIHVTFMRFLADRDELVQESASRGLSLVYEIGDYDLKDSLVRGLLKSFTDNNTQSSLISGTVEEDTQLFEPDLLKTHDGSVSTYRDVLNLASDVGDPSLVYKFMSLAKSSALWSSRKGMAFGLGSILSKTSLDDMLANNKNLADRLIPKLYRYRYDPSTSVSTSMTDIWNVLVPDSNSVIKAHFSNILDELLKGMGNKEWRVRQASTTALNDLLNVVTLETYESRLEEIWNMSFRVMDDIKESVRKEGTKVTKLLATILTKAADVKSGSSSNSRANDILNQLIPFLLGNKGLLSDAEEIRSFALDTILKLVKVGDQTIKPFIPKLLDNFISLMSTLEPEAINYLILNADKYNLKSDEIDAKRLQSIGQSPMMDAIEKLVDQLDPDNIEESINVLQTVIKKSVGLPSKVSGSKVLVSLITKKYELIKPYGEKLMKVALTQISDRNDTVASSYSMAVGYLCRLCSAEVAASIGEQLRVMYFENDDERNRLIAAVVSENVSKYSGEKFETVASEFLPLCFVGQNDTSKSVKNIFERQWIENTSGANAIKLYMNEIIDIIEKYFNSNRYEIRQILAKSIAKLTSDLSDFSSFSDKTISKIFAMLQESCKGKSWSGKEVVFDALVNFSIKLEGFLIRESDLLESINKVVLTEGKRRNKEYQRESIKIMGKYLHHFPDDELTETYIQIITSILDGSYEDSDDEMDGIEETRSSKRLNNSVSNKLEEEKMVYVGNLFESFTSKMFNNELFQLMNETFINIFKNHNKFEITWRTKVKANECFNGLLKEIEDVELSESHTELLFKFWTKLEEYCSDISNIENVKIKFIRNSKQYSSYLEKFDHKQLAHQVSTSLNKFSLESSTVIKGELAKSN